MLVDSHCHLDYAAPEERAEILARARQAGVQTLLTISTKLSEFAAVRAIAAGDADVWCSVGIHPHEAASEEDPGVAGLVSLAQHEKVVGIGETGLDFYYEHSPRPRQESLFRTHCAAARETGLPLIVHTRDADPETAAILAEEKPPAGVIHCFSTGRQLAERRLNLASISRCLGSSPSRMPRRCARSPATSRSSGCWSRPTRPISRRCRCVASATSRPSSSTPRRCWPSSRASRSRRSPRPPARISSDSSVKRAVPGPFRARNDAGLRPVLGRAAHRRRVGRVRSAEPAQPAAALLGAGGGGRGADPQIGRASWRGRG